MDKPKSMGRSGRNELHQERRASKEVASSRGQGGGRKALVVGDDGSGRCGICSAHVAVRGVLDCCSHEYCFDCIENWSSVSNLCPLCKLQFRFISVENVHDQESDIVENLSPFPAKQEREEESWDNEAALPFSFPSFFIDEDAVACLEGNRCLVRAGVPLQDEDAADTSVACDSCDRWYHAGCVGFDPSISWGSWLCPRCSEKASALRPPPTSLPPILPITTVVSSPILPITTVVSSSTSGRVPVAELAYDATVFFEGDPTVSISVVGEGESALMLSTFRAVESTILSPSKLETRQASTFTDGKCPDPRGQASIVVKSEEITYAPLEDKATRIQAPGPSALEKLYTEGQKPVPAVPSITKPEIKDSMRADCDLVGRRPNEAIDSLTMPVPSAKAEQRDPTVLPSTQLLQSEEPKTDQGNESILELGVAENADLPASYFDNLEFEEQPRKEKRKQSTRQDRDIIRAEDLPEPPRKIARSAVKKIDTGKGSTSGPPLEKIDVHSPKDSKVSTTNETLPSVKKQVDEEISFTEDVPVEDLVHIVKDERTVGTGVVKEEHTGGIGSNSAGGVRTRVVMRRESDGRAAQIVDDIRQQMRAAAGYGATDDHCKVAVSDERFFSAFKAAMVRNQEQNQGVKSQGLKRRRNSWLEKMLDKAPRGKAGGVRESLTKKLYAGGVSRKTWDRDWDISFWKEQSARIKKAKQEASDVVEGRSGVRIKEEGVKEEVILQKLKNIDAEGDSILSRLYVADTSLFPRNNDIKPLISMLGDVKEEGRPKCLGGERATSEPKSLKSQTSMGRKSTETKPTQPSRAGGASINGTVIPAPQGLKIPSCDTSEKTSKSIMKGSGLPGTHKHVDASSIVKASGAPDSEEKKDKRQWALELLARRSGDAVTSSSAKCQGGTKKDSSLLVPEVLRPTLPPDRRSRVPTAVRQSQLNRILEHYLRKAKLTSLQGGYKLKSVIASAVAKEFEIYESSNSKGVYVNLCVRALAQQDEVRLEVSIPEFCQPDEAAAVTEALLATGLISDSPPGSPCTETGKARPSNQGPEDLPMVQEVSVSSRMFTGSTGTAENSLSEFSDSINASQLPYSQAGDVENVLEISQPVSLDVFNETDLDLEVKSCEGNAVSSARSASPRNKMKVVLTKRNNSPQVPTNNEKNLEESSTGREGTGTVVSPSSQEGKSVDVLVNSAANFSNGGKTNETSTLAKVGNECSVAPVEEKSGALNTKKVELESKLGGVDSDGDDWMNTGKFPDLESRIDKMRKDVLKRNSSFLSQLGEEHIFGGSFQEPTSTNEARPEGGKTAKPSSDANISNRKANGSNPFGKESEAPASVQKQVEAYVKEHLKPLYKSGVIKSDQFRYAVSKTASKVMQHHGDATSADFLIVEGSKVKKLADQYLQSYVQKK